MCHPAITKLLLESGADTSIQDHKNLTALHWAAYQMWPQKVQLLVAAGADIEALDAEGSRPLTYVNAKKCDPSSPSDEAVIRRLLEAVPSNDKSDAVSKGT